MMFRIRLKILRENKGLNQRELASELGVSPGAIGMWESGGREPKTLKMLQEIADFFEVSTDYLLGRDEKEKPTPISEGRPLYPPEYDVLSSEDKVLVNNMIRSLAGKQQPVSAPTTLYIAAYDGTRTKAAVEGDVTLPEEDTPLRRKK